MISGGIQACFNCASTELKAHCGSKMCVWATCAECGFVNGPKRAIDPKDGLRF